MSDPRASKEQSLPRAIWHGSFQIFGVNVMCYVTSDGRAIVDADSLAALIEAMEAPEGREVGELEQFLRWQQEYRA